ncbi:guanine nucleotide exchange factor [Epithele typhae]|uniref:guanine nucleotide exchange factor n=1 Tax=Epithele typhae TaxID=378194 RepID=UPI00200774F1|nr:guanine nucleotide exchange factor [Epithele typhae]KAH9941215.1 guanine nucleotide exchange factor [Epithele typhae]
MSDHCDAYTALSPASLRSEVAEVLQAIADASASTIIAATAGTELVQLLIDDIVSSSDTSTRSRLSREDGLLALQALRTLGSKSTGAKVIGTAANFTKLLSIYAAYEGTPEASGTTLRCLANTLLQVESARVTFVEEPVAGGHWAVEILKKSESLDLIFFAARVLLYAIVSDPADNRAAADRFVASAIEREEDPPTVVDILSQKLDVASAAVLSGAQFGREALVDLLKVIGLVIVSYTTTAGETPQDSDPAWNERLDGLLPALIRAFHSIPPSTTPLPYTSPLTNAVVALDAVPISPSLKPIWFPTEGSHGDMLLRAYDVLDATLARYMPGRVEADDPVVEEQCKEVGEPLNTFATPLVLLICKLCAADEHSRRRMREWLLPDDLDRSTHLEIRADLLGRLLRLLVSMTHSLLKQSVGEMLFAICEFDGRVLASAVGYGNVAGFLFHKGISNTGAQTPTGVDVRPARQTTPDGVPIDPVTGVARDQGPPVDLTEEEREREAEKLFVLFHRLEQTGAIAPEHNPVRMFREENHDT